MALLVLWLLAIILLAGKSYGQTYSDQFLVANIRTTTLRPSYYFFAANSPLTETPREYVKRVIPRLFDFAVIDELLKCESGWNPDSVGDHGRSFGLWQINLYNPKGEKVHNVSEQCALDIYCSTEYAIKLMNSKRGLKHWSCYGI